MTSWRRLSCISVDRQQEHNLALYLLACGNSRQVARIWLVLVTPCEVPSCTLAMYCIKQVQLLPDHEDETVFQPCRLISKGLDQSQDHNLH
jgi:hypothetical protein